MNIELLRFPHKQIRAKVIKEYISGKPCVCFSCGNAAKALENEGIEVLHIGPHGVLEPKKWFSQLEIAETFSNYFDATSGNLSMELMLQIGNAYKKYLGELTSPVYVPSGSGETVLCLKLAYPEIDFVAVYNLDEATEYSEQSPLNKIVEIICKKVIKTAVLLNADQA